MTAQPQTTSVANATGEAAGAAAPGFAIRQLLPRSLRSWVWGCASEICA